MLLRWRNASGAVGQTYIYQGLPTPDAWGTLYIKTVAPAGTTRMRVSFEQAASGSPEYIDIAEWYARKV